MDLVHNTISYASKHFCSSCPSVVETTTGLVESSDKKKTRSTYLSRLSNMLSFGLDMIRGSTGAHGHFLHYDVDALTISTRPKKIVEKSRNIKITDLGRLVERVVRSMSNTEERLHHSYWVYLMPSHRQFVSIEEYVYAYFFLLFGAAYQLIKARRQRSSVSVDDYVSNCVLPVLLTFATGALSFAFMNNDSSPFLLLSLPCLVVCLVIRFRLNVDIDSCHDLITKIFIITHVPLAVMNFSLGVLAALVGNVVFFISGLRSFAVRNLLLLLLSPGLLLYLLMLYSNDSLWWEKLMSDWNHRRNGLLPYLFILYSPMLTFLCVFGHCDGAVGDAGGTGDDSEKKKKD